MYAIALYMGLAVLGQLNIPDRIDPYKPIVAGCDCVTPDNGDIQIMWRTDDAAQNVPSEDSKKLFIWAPPGNHWTEALVVTKYCKDVQTLEVDPANPSDQSKWKVKTIKVIDSVDFQRYQKNFLIGDAPPPTPVPNPTPTPTPTPSPTDDFAIQCQAWLKAIPTASYNKQKALGIADNYSSVAAQAVATTGWNLSTFAEQTKLKNYQTLTTDEVAAWATPFFQPLFQYQSKLFSDRKLTTTDVPGIAQLWKDTADAIRKAAF